MWVHDAVVVHHGQHEGAGEGMAVEKGDGWHGKGQDASEEGVEAVGDEGAGPGCVVEVEAVAVESIK